jgi:hypothetical protein
MNLFFITDLIDYLEADSFLLLKNIISDPVIIIITVKRINSGFLHCNPGLVPAYAVDHNRQAMTAQNIVFPFWFKE